MVLEHIGVRLQDYTIGAYTIEYTFEHHVVLSVDLGKVYVLEVAFLCRSARVM